MSELDPISPAAFDCLMEKTIASTDDPRAVTASATDLMVHVLFSLGYAAGLERLAKAKGGR